MSQELTFTLELQSGDQLLRGQSCFFKATLLNASQRPIAISARLESDEAPVVLTLREEGAAAAAPDTSGEIGVLPPESAGKTATIASPRERQGVYRHGHGERTPVQLRPDEQSILEGDLLEWFGDIRPGTYILTADYVGSGLPITSKPVTLTITGRQLRALNVPRRGAVHYSTPPAAVMTLSKGGVLLAQRGDGLPRHPRRGVLAAFEGSTALFPAADSSQFVAAFQCIERNDSGLSVIRADLTPRVPAAAPSRKAIAGPAPDVILRSPLSTRDGSLYYVEVRGGNVNVIRLAPGAADPGQPLHSFKLPGAEIGAYVCCWNQEQQLHFIWCNQGDRTVKMRTISLTDAAAPVAEADLFSAPGDVLHLEATIDTEASLAAGGAMFKEFGNDENKPRPATPTVCKVFIAARQGSIVTIFRHDTYNRSVTPIATFADPKDAGEVKITECVLRKDLVPCYLAADATGTVWYASPTRSTWSHLHLTGEEMVNVKNTPVLFAGGSTATLPWVYVAWIGPDSDVPVFQKVEPPGETEPKGISSATAHQCGHC